MEWEKQKFLIEMELEKLRVERDSLLSWIRFLQTALMVVFSAVVGLFYKKEISHWIGAGIIACVIIVLDLLFYYGKLKKITQKIETYKLLLARKL